MSVARQDVGLVIAGQAGQGIQLVSGMLARLFVRQGYHVLLSHDVMSRIRGGHNFARLRVSDQPVRADADQLDVAVLLDPALLSAYAGSGARVLVEAEAAEHITPVPFAHLAREHGQSEVMANSVALGAVLSVLGMPLDPLLSVLERDFGAKGADVVARNVRCARAGFERVPAQPDLKLTAADGQSRLFVTGAQALALGCLAGGARFFAGYPMSPATPVFEYLAQRAAELGIIYEQPEDEIAAVNMALGASFAGATAVTGTSAGGFSLMCEGLSLAGMTETPLVLLLGMRPGPATGMATRTAQADLLFSLYAGHGEFARIVLTPADAVQAFDAARQAVQLAEQYQTQVIVLFDQYLADAGWTVDALDSGEKYAGGGTDVYGPAYSYRRYELTDSGISPRLLPGTSGQVVYADSDEHNEAGHITESAGMRMHMVAKRARKLAGVELPGPERLGPDDAQDLVFCFGSTRGIVAEALKRLQARDASVAMVHLSRVWPFPADEVAALAAKAKRTFTVEGNHSAQLAQLLTQESRLRIAGSVRKYDGRQLSVAEVEAGLERLLNE